MSEHENPTSPQPVLRLTIELPGVYTADLEGLVERAMDWDDFDRDEKGAELEAYFNALQIAPAVGVRCMVSGEKDAETMTIKGRIVGIGLTETP